MTNWADDPANDIDWRNYRRGYDDATQVIPGPMTPDEMHAHLIALGHGIPYADGYHDGMLERDAP